jgi:hypothetical protein
MKFMGLGMGAQKVTFQAEVGATWGPGGRDYGPRRKRVCPLARDAGAMAVGPAHSHSAPLLARLPTEGLSWIAIHSPLFGSPTARER